MGSYIRTAIVGIAGLGVGAAIAAGAPREMVELVPAFIAKTVSPDMAGPGDVKAAPFAACLYSKGVTVAAMRAAMKTGTPDRQMTACLDKFVGL